MHTCGHAGAGLVKLAQAHSSGGSIRGSHMQRRERLQDYYYKRSTRRHRRHGTRPTYVDQHLSLRKRPKATGTQNQPLAYHARRHGKHREHARHSPRGTGQTRQGRRCPGRPHCLGFSAAGQTAGGCVHRLMTLHYSSRNTCSP